MHERRQSDLGVAWSRSRRYGVLKWMETVSMANTTAEPLYQTGLQKQTGTAKVTRCFLLQEEVYAASVSQKQATGVSLV